MGGIHFAMNIDYGRFGGFALVSDTCEHMMECLGFAAEPTFTVFRQTPSSQIVSRR